MASNSEETRTYGRELGFMKAKDMRMKKSRKRKRKLKTIPIPKAKVFDPDFTSKIEEKVAQQQNEKIKAADSDSYYPDPNKVFAGSNAERILALGRARKPPPRQSFLYDESNQEVELEQLGMTQEEWNAYLDKHPSILPFQVKMMRFHECVVEFEEKLKKGQVLPFQESRPVTVHQYDDDDDSCYEEETFVGDFTHEDDFMDDDDDGFNDEIVVNKPPKGFGREENFIKQDPAKDGIKSAKAGKKEEKKRIKSAN